MRSRRFPAALAALALLAVAACSGGSTGTASGGGGSASGGGGSRPPAATNQGSTGAPTSTAPSGTVADAVPPVPTGQGPRIVRAASLTVQVANGKFDSALTRLIDLAAREGGYVAGSNAVSDDSERIRTGTITFAVPSDKYEETIGQVRGYGTVQAFNSSAQDVSQQYVDLSSRLKNAEAQRDAMLALLQRATSINDIISIQNQLGQITGLIEQLKGQIAFLEHATGYSTINVTLREAAVLAPRTTDELGIQGALHSAVYDFFQSIDFMVVALGALAPYLLIALAGFGAFTIRRRRRPARA
jgi:hypothetical protein